MEIEDVPKDKDQKEKGKRYKMEIPYLSLHLLLITFSFYGKREGISPNKPEINKKERCRLIRNPILITVPF